MSTESFESFLNDMKPHLEKWRDTRDPSALDTVAEKLVDKITYIFPENDAARESLGWVVPRARIIRGMRLERLAALFVDGLPGFGKFNAARRRRKAIKSIVDFAVHRGRAG